MIGFFAIPAFLFGFFHEWLFYVGLLIEAAHLIKRGVMLGRLPLVGLQDTLLFLSLSTGLFASVLKRYEGRIIKPVIIICLVFTVFGVVSPSMDYPLPPVLRTYWFEIHVVLSFFSYGLFGVGAVLGLIYLIRGTQKTEAYQYRVVFVGYIMFSLSMIAGGIWAFFAWGRYWLWTPKEIWTTLVWLHYTMYLHIRYIQGWKGRRAAIAGVLGYGIVLFTYLGVGLLMKSSHSF